MSLLDLRVLGDPILRQPTRAVAKMTDELRDLIDDMFETMGAAKGIGLAAPQVGRGERIAVVDVEGARHALVNPEIVLREGSVRGEEGCLSIPEIYGEIERAERVVVRALDRDGRPFEVAAAELLARCLQHEIDHLDGKLFIDYLSILKRRSALARWAKEKDRYPNFVRRLTPEDVAAHHRDEEL
ncbi:MAG TPA: peptide deformylase [Gemmatimonadaceae bacterium]|nr:peptide deformylase [Gemmatimonadaceae bacterium]